MPKPVGSAEKFTPQILEKNDQRRKHMKSKTKTGGYIIRGSAVAVLLLLALASLTSAFNLVDSSPSLSSPYAPSVKRVSTSPGDVAVDVGNNRIKKLSASDGTVLWSASVVNDSALAVDPVDLGVYTGYGSHGFGRPGTVYKYAADGTLAWRNSIVVDGPCNFYYVSYAAVDTTSANVGVVWTQSGCFGGIAKTSRDTGAQQWSVFTNDIGRASIDPVNGEIYDITNAGPQYNYDTLYSASADGTMVSATTSCESYTDLNPADAMLYRGGDTRSSGCGLILYQLNKSHLCCPNWSLDLSGQISSFDALAVQPWSGGYIYVASVSSSKIVVVDPATRTVVRSFITKAAPNYIAVNPINGNVYITDGASHFVYAYSPTGTLVWTSPDLGGAAGSIAAPRVVASRLSNISSRAFVQTGDNAMIGGFIVQGTGSKRVIIRAIGPELTQYGVPNVLANPTLELHDGTGALIASNNNWVTTIIGGIIITNQVRDIQASGYAPGDALESAIIADLTPGNYTAIVRGVNNMTGVALVEVYDLSPQISSILGNISTRALVQTDDNVMIGGFIVQGTGPKRVIVRALGPELSQYGVPNTLPDPTLELHDSTGALIASNDNWKNTIIGGIITRGQVMDIQNSGYAPSDSRESAIIANLPPGNYTAIVRGKTIITGVALIEVYDLH
jgi:YVTN family beta-propeller protein